MNKKAIKFRNGTISGQVSLLGAMLGPVEFQLPNGQTVQPFSVVPWADDPKTSLDQLPFLLKNLGGEWPCVPFGLPEPRTDLPTEWLQNINELKLFIEDSFMHGFSSNHDWQDISPSNQEAKLTIDYPPTHPVKKLTRRISAVNNNQLDFELSITTDKPVELPIGLHGVFKLPKKAGKAKLVVDSFIKAYTYPISVEPDVSILQPNQTITNLEQVQRLDGGSIDITTLPLKEATEELILLNLGDGKIQLQNLEERYEVVFEWDIEQFPSCLLWISNRGRSHYPWNSRFQAIGIEPIASAFDLGVVHSRNTTSPLRKDGIKTSFKLDGVDRFRYRVLVRGI